MATMTDRGSFLRLSTQEQFNIVFEPLVRSMLDYGSYDVMTGVDNEAKIAYFRQMEKILRRDAGCGFNPRGNNLIYDRTIRVRPVKAEMSLCTADLRDTVFKAIMSKPAGQQYGLKNRNNRAIAAIFESMKKAIESDIYRLFWFGDESSSDTFYNQLNGLWGHYIPELIANGDLSPIDAGSGSALQPGDGIAIFKEMWEKQSKELRGIPRRAKILKVDSDLYDQYQDDLEGLGGGDAGRTALINGVETLAYRGIPVMEEPLFDEIKKDATGDTLPKLAILTIPENLIIATDVLSNKNVTETWINEEEETSNARVKFKLGANYMHQSLMVVAQ